MIATRVRVDQSSGESMASASEVVMVSSPVTLMPIGRPSTVMPYPMSNVAPVPTSTRGVIRPASRELPAPRPQQVPRSQLMPAWNSCEPKPPPP
eukprot:10465132-Karenia_brevis.AAC.1